jgi:hypothetical protein
VTQISEAGPFCEAAAEDQEYFQRYRAGYTSHFQRRVETGTPRNRGLTQREEPEGTASTAIFRALRDCPRAAPRQPARGSREPKPSVVFGPGFGVTLMLAFGSYVGFEAAALYGEEAANPKLSVPRATFIALGLMTVFYLVTTWAAISAYGVDQAQVPQARTRASSCSLPTRSTLAGSRPMRCRSSS